MINGFCVTMNRVGISVVSVAVAVRWASSLGRHRGTTGHRDQSNRLICISANERVSS